eukprot:EC120551.1.p2 GENE.EC120551.1~~EC120551.1.p2  ORF type:complete len:140 (+),score=31.29 EC120551.1:69-488(+)
MAAFVSAPVFQSSFAGARAGSFFSAKTSLPIEMTNVCVAENDGRMRMGARIFEVTVVFPGKADGQIRDQSQARFAGTSLKTQVAFEQWFQQQQVWQKQGAKILKVRLVSGQKNTNTGIKEMLDCLQRMSRAFSVKDMQF